MILINRIQILNVIIALLLLVNSQIIFGQNGCPEIPKSALNGFNGFSVEGKSSADDVGYTTKSAGDINHDGIPDIMIGAPGVDFGGIENVGEIYVIFGKAGLSITSFDVTTLDGTNGFVIRGITLEEKLGSMISTAGDFNNDGVDDIIVGDNNGLNNQGSAFVFYGSKTGFLPLYTKANLTITNSVTFTVDTYSETNVSDVSYAGDLNNDGISDIIFMYKNNTANFFIVFGKAGITNLNVSELNGINGFYILGFTQTYSGDKSTGRNAGDINNDGIDDLILGFPYYNEPNSNKEGRAVVWFGKNAYSPKYEINLMTASNGFIFTNTGDYSETGTSVAAAGDFNKDGIDDVIIGAPGKSFDGKIRAGEAYIVFGRNSTFPLLFPASSLSSSNGVLFQGKKTYDHLGEAVNGLKDINKDGIHDVIISAKTGGKADNGVCYIVFGGTTASGIVQTETIFGTKGYQVFDDELISHTFFGKDAGGIGDFNADGINDFIIGSVSDVYNHSEKGFAYVFYSEKLDRIDAVPPTITCPANQSLYANASLPDYVSFLPGVNDNCTDNMDLIFTQTPPQGTLFTADTNVKITVKDKSGNINSCSFLVKLNKNIVDINCKTSSFSVADLNGNNGFTIYGEKTTREAGSSVSTAGDVNGDGITDFIIGAPGDYNPWYGKYESEYRVIKGAAYLVYGTGTGFPPNIDLGLLNGTNGFAIRNDNVATNFPLTGYAVGSAGDINGDGIGDFMVSDPYRHSSYGQEVGHTYIIFGTKTGFPAEFNLSTLNGNNGFSLIGVSNYGDVGISIDNIGDINGDGIQDIAAISGGSGAGNGKCFVVYGSHAGFPAVLLTSQINGINGFTIEGDGTVGPIGTSVSGLGDINGDGISDFAMGSYNGHGRRFVVYGRSSNFPSTLNISALNGGNGFIIENTATPLNSYLGVSKVGDINGDGYNDIAVIKDYIVFGGSAIPAKMDLKNLNGTNGFKLTNGNYGIAFGPAGDFNADGLDDYVFQNASNFYILFGKKTWTPTVDVSWLTVKDGLNVGTLSANPFTSSTISYSVNYAGDVNKDGISDLIIGNSFDSYGSNLKVNALPGFAFVIYGKKITDTEKPLITNCPANKLLAIGNLIPDFKNEITVTDNCDDNPVITQTPVAGAIYTGGIQVVTLTATDAQGNFRPCTLTISSVADQKPEIICVGDQELACGALVPDYTSMISVKDDNDPNPVITQSPIPGSVFVSGMTITITAKDASNNKSDCSFKVNASADTTKPVISCIGNQILNAGDVLPDYSSLITATDNCDTAPIITQNPVAGTTFVNGMTVVISAKDASGNIQPCSFTISESADSVKPQITCPANQSASCSTTVIQDYTSMVSVTDNKDPHPLITQSPIAGSAFVPGMTITITAKDASNNKSDCSFIVNASADVTKPVISCIGNQVLNAGDVLPDYLSLITVKDNCDSAPTITQNPMAGTTFVNGMTVTITAKDASGNVQPCSFTITETADTETPKITCIGDQNVACSTKVIPDYTSMITVKDNKDPNPIIKQSPIAGTIFTDGMTITITATDASNNKSECPFQVYSNVLLVDAGNDVEINEGESIQINAITTEGGNFKWSPSNGISNVLISNPLFSPIETTTYTVVFTNKDNCEVEDSVIISVISKEKDETKYGFSPNNDGINDYWTIDKITDYPNNKVSIYNRWGDLVFQTTGYNNTTNVFTGNANKRKNLGADELPEGTYFFEINPNSSNHHFKKLKGYLVLKR